MLNIKLYRTTCLSLGPWVGIQGFQKLEPDCENESWSFPTLKNPGALLLSGGIGDYGSDESEDEDDRSARGSESSDTDEEELRHRIREKQDAFRRKEREMQQLLEKQAQEALLARGKT